MCCGFIAVMGPTWNNIQKFSEIKEIQSLKEGEKSALNN